jgi:AraC-like DNA-binding protein
MERGDFEIVAPPEHLRPFVRRYLYANRRLQAGVTFHAKPTGYAYLSNFFGQSAGDHHVMNGKRFDRALRWFFFGQITDHEVIFHHAQSLELIVCELTATGHHRLFGISGQRVLGLAAPFEEAAPEQVSLAKECFILGPEAPRDDHVAEANGFIGRLAAHARAPDPTVEQAVAMLEGSNGAARIADVCERLGVGRRKLDRRFSDIVGVSPKLFAQVMQINWVVSLLYSDDKAGLAQLALEAGFYDQAHFNHAMQRFFREGPREFLHSEHPAFRSFLAGSRRFGPTSSMAD